MIISLCGYMGAGKSCVARKIAELSNYEYIDLDYTIEKSEGMTTNQIFTKYGEGHFRKLERQYIEKLSTLEHNVIISLGGGSVMDVANRDMVKKCSTLVYIQVPFDVCYGRISHSNRPIVARNNKSQLQEHYKSRLKSYEDSDYKVDGNMSVIDVAKQIINLLKI